ncbi:hypothetical protein SASPL_117957 [Salvia splendens]|uniref:Trichome birefringence-like C-terminal domain-containing protein n=1 Tax=Salvia splendens TaxID=180675 RepID=A0A8X8XWT5_SALSN|nr:hypothetical protein SASPL_117957 [Salvia splendens]
MACMHASFTPLSPSSRCSLPTGTNLACRTAGGRPKPVEGSTFPVSKPPGDAVIRTVLSNMDKPATLLDILLLTQLGKDGHPSTYAGGGIDCSHWCLAGVPDTWNQLLYTILLQS